MRRYRKRPAEWLPGQAMRTVLARLARAARPRARSLLALAALSAAGSLAEVAAALAVVRVAAALAVGASTVQIGPWTLSAPAALAGACLALVARVAAQLAVARRASHLSAQVEAAARLRVADALLASSADAARAVEPGALLHAATVLPNHTQQAISALTAAATSSAGLCVVAVGALWSGPLVALALGGAAATLALVVSPVRRRSARLSRRRLAAEAELASAFDEVARRGKEIRAFGVADAVATELDTWLDRAWRLRAETHALGRASSDLVVGVAPLIVVGVVAAAPRPFDASWAAAAWLLLRAAQQASLLSTAVQQAVEAGPAFAALDALAARLPDERAGTGALLAGDWHLHDFAASRGRMAALSSTWKAGELVLLVGPSGSGKSSLLLALAGLATSTGAVRIGDRDSAPADRRASTALVPQRPTLLPASLRDNVAFFRDGVTDDAVGDALRRAGIEVTAWREGLDTPLTDDGVSGGERQRIGVARALLRPTGALLLDEPTSGLDPQSTAALAHLLSALRADGLLVIVATHDVGAFGAATHTVRAPGGGA